MKIVIKDKKEQLLYQLGRCEIERRWAGLFAIMNAIMAVTNGFHWLSVTATLCLAGSWYYHNKKADDLIMTLESMENKNAKSSPESA